jgi:hypothetical protein
MPPRRPYRVIQGQPRMPRFQETMPAGAARLGAAIATTPQGIAAHDPLNPWNLLSGLNNIQNEINSLLGIPTHHSWAPKVSIDPVTGDLKVTSPLGPSQGSEIGTRLSGAFDSVIANAIGVNQQPGSDSGGAIQRRWRVVQGSGYGTELVSDKPSGAGGSSGQSGTGGSQGTSGTGQHSTLEKGRVGAVAWWLGAKVAKTVAGRLKPYIGDTAADYAGDAVGALVEGAIDISMEYPAGGDLGPVRPYYPAGGGYGRPGKMHLSQAQAQQLITAVNVILHHLATAIGHGGGSSHDARPTKTVEQAILHGMKRPSQWVEILG